MEKPHKKLDVWKASIELVVAIYSVTSHFPKEELYGLSGQLRRAALSVPANIAEGAARQTHREFTNFLQLAQGSLSELDTELEVAKRLEYINEQSWHHLDLEIERIDKMMSGLIRHLRSKRGDSQKSAR